MENLSLEEQRLLQDELSSGESLLWTGRPNPRVIFHASDLFMIPFSLLWGGFALFWEAGVSGIGPWASKGQWNFGMLWGIPFVVIGQYMIWGRFAYAAWKKARILYALTSERLLVIVRPPQKKVISKYLRTIQGINKEIRADGIGTLKFGETESPFSSRGGQNMDTLYLNASVPVFVDINSARDVAEQITCEIQRESRSGSTALLP